MNAPAFQLVATGSGLLVRQLKTTWAVSKVYPAGREKKCVLLNTIPGS